MDAQAPESAVLFEHFQNIGELDVVGIGFAAGVGIALFRQEIVQEAQEGAKHSQNGYADGIALGGFVVLRQDNGEDHHSRGCKQNTAEAPAEDSWARSTSLFAMAESREPIGMFSMDYSTFYRAFKKEFGISPSRYKQVLKMLPG